jgi:hypothetical protein
MPVVDDSDRAGPNYCYIDGPPPIAVANRFRDHAFIHIYPACAKHFQRGWIDNHFSESKVAAVATHRIRLHCARTKHCAQHAAGRTGGCAFRFFSKES